MRVVVAPDKFKGSLTAHQAAKAIAEGLTRARPGVEILLLPIADGGDGTIDTAISAGFSRVRVLASGPTGEPIEAAIAVRDGTAIVEMAQASGMQRLPGGRPAPLTATTRGTGEMIVGALDHAITDLVLGIGGSATTDGGTGMAAALGVRFLDSEGSELPPGGSSLSRLSRIDVSALDPRLAGVRVVVATDVDNPLFGHTGAAHVYGPQKGATPEDVQALDAGLRRYAEVVLRDVGLDVSTIPGAGAAGGLGAGAMAFLHATPRSGIQLLLELVRFDRALIDADLVITGEGRFDDQSLHGKAVMGVASAAAAAGVPVVVLAGQVRLSPAQVRGAGFLAAHALTDLETDPDRCLTDATRLLERLAAGVATSWVA